MTISFDIIYIIVFNINILYPSKYVLGLFCRVFYFIDLKFLFILSLKIQKKISLFK